jgi:hypothetical protein
MAGRAETEAMAEPNASHEAARILECGEFWSTSSGDTRPQPRVRKEREELVEKSVGCWELEMESPSSLTPRTRRSGTAALGGLGSH